MEKYRYFRNNIFDIYLLEENEKVDISCSIYLYVKDIYIDIRIELKGRRRRRTSGDTERRGKRVHVCFVFGTRW